MGDSLLCFISAHILHTIDLCGGPQGPLGQAKSNAGRQLRAQRPAVDGPASRTVTKITVIGRIRPFLLHEKVDDVILVEKGAVLVKDLPVPRLVTRYPFFYGLDLWRLD